MNERGRFSSAPSPCSHSSMNAPFLLEEVQHPEAGIDFVFPVLFIAELLLATIATVPAWRERAAGPSGSRAPDVLTAAAGALVIVLGAFGIVSNARWESPAAMAGDLTVQARDFEFAATELAASPGEVTVHVEITGVALHSFTINELGVDVFVPAGRSARVTFAAQPGTYRLHCSPHAADMAGGITVG